MKCDTVAAWQTRRIPKSQRTVWRALWQPGDWLRFFCPVSPVLDNPDSKHFQHQNTSSNWCRGHRMSHTTLWLTASNARFFVRPFSGSGSQTWASWHLAVKSHWSLLFITGSPAVILSVLWKCSFYYCHGFYQVISKWACSHCRCLEHCTLLCGSSCQCGIGKGQESYFDNILYSFWSWSFGGLQRLQIKKVGLSSVVYWILSFSCRSHHVTNRWLHLQGYKLVHGGSNSSFYVSWSCGGWSTHGELSEFLFLHRSDTRPNCFGLLQ